MGADAHEIETWLTRPSAHEEGSSGVGGKRKQGEVSSASSSKKQKTMGQAQRREPATIQTGLYAAEMFAANLMSSRLINFIIIGELDW